MWLLESVQEGCFAWLAVMSHHPDFSMPGSLAVIGSVWIHVLWYRAIEPRRIKDLLALLVACIRHSFFLVYEYTSISRREEQQ